MLDRVQAYTSHHQTLYEHGTRCTRIQELHGTSGFDRHCPELVRGNYHWKLQGEHVIECGLDEWLNVWLFAPLGKLEKDVEDADCAMGCTEVVDSIEVILKNTT